MPFCDHSIYLKILASNVISRYIQIIRPLEESAYGAVLFRCPYTLSCGQTNIKSIRWYSIQKCGLSSTVARLTMIRLGQEGQ